MVTVSIYIYFQVFTIFSWTPGLLSNIHNLFCDIRSHDQDTTNLRLDPIYEVPYRYGETNTGYRPTFLNKQVLPKDWCCGTHNSGPGSCMENYAYEIPCLNIIILRVSFLIKL